MSMRTIARSSSNKYSANARASSVLVQRVLEVDQVRELHELTRTTTTFPTIR